ncbi:MAG: hypothetical protein RI922_2584 [Bacteroidota bacterium]
MKKRLFILIFLINSVGLIAQTQDTNKVVISTSNPILYLGYPYQIEIGNNLGRTDYRIEGKNVIIVKDTLGDGYTLNCASTELDAEIYFIDNLLKDTFSIRRYQVESMPKVELFLGQFADGEYLTSRTADRLYVRYGPEIPLTKCKFKVDAWILSISGYNKPVSGSGETLSEDALALLKNAKKGSIVMLSCKYSGTGTGIKVCSSSFKI